MPTFSASSLPPPALAPSSAACTPPQAEPGPLHLHSLVWNLRVPSPSPTALRLEPFAPLLLMPPRHFSFRSCLPTRAQHTSSGPEARADTCSVSTS